MIFAIMILTMMIMIILLSSLSLHCWDGKMNVKKIYNYEYQSLGFMVLFSKKR